jgi:hypothetical protein
MLLTYENIHEQLIIYYFKISYDALYHSKNFQTSNEEVDWTDSNSFVIK